MRLIFVNCCCDKPLAGEHHEPALPTHELQCRAGGDEEPIAGEHPEIVSTTQELHSRGPLVGEHQRGVLLRLRAQHPDELQLGVGKCGVKVCFG